MRGEPVRVVRGATEDAARTASGECPIALEHRREWGTLTYRNACAQSLDEKGRVLGELLTALFGEGLLPDEIGSLALGRMVELSEELSRRLALDAHRSPAWPEVLRKQAPLDLGTHGAANRFVGEWIDASDAYHALEAPLVARGVTPQAGTVEKVLITPPAPTSLGEWLREQGVPPDARVPFDAIVWLVLLRAPVPSP